MLAFSNFLETFQALWLWCYLLQEFPGTFFDFVSMASHKAQTEVQDFSFQLLKLPVILQHETYKVSKSHKL
jgi:hypothetical protein